MTEQRCTAEIHDGRYVGDSAIVQVSVCNLPIEKVGSQWRHASSVTLIYPDHEAKP